MKANKLELKHNNKEFEMKINGQKINCVEEYSLSFKGNEYPYADLTIKISINEEISNNDISKIRVKMRLNNLHNIVILHYLNCLFQ